MSDAALRKVRLVVVVEATIVDPTWTTETLIENTPDYFDSIIADGERQSKDGEVLYGWGPAAYRIGTGSKDGPTVFAWDDFLRGLKDGTVEADIRGDWRSIPPADKVEV